MDSAVDQAAAWVRRRGGEPRLAIDGTAGNGHDTLFLARLVGEEGRVIAVDIQEEALASTARRLDAAGLKSRVTLVCGDHADLAKHIPREWSGQVDRIMFNLGYLPGGDKEVTTGPRGTLEALSQARRLMRPSGACLTVVVYTGHPGGPEETATVREWFQRRGEQGDMIWTGGVPGGRKDPPLALGLET